MEKFVFTVKAQEGLHARPAGLLVKCLRECGSSTTLEFRGKSVDGRRLFAVMGLGVKQGDQIVFMVEGPEESADRVKIGKFCEANL